MLGATGLDPNFIFALVAGIIGMLFFAFVVILFVVFYQKRMVKQQAEIQLLETEHQKDLLTSAIHAQENERKRIAVDLHDGIGGLLSAAKLYINQLGPDMPETDYRSIKEETNSLLDETIGNIRTIHHDLQPASLENLGLTSAVEGLCKRFREFLDIELYYQQETRFNKTKEITLYRIIQELLNNTLKHAEAQKVSLSFVFNAKALTITYKDDGKGFELSELKVNKTQNNGLGLKSIESRVRSINGQLEYQSSVGNGVEVKITALLD
jgi:signal transduction histidine kinase